MKKLKLTKYDVSQNFRKLFLFLNILFHRAKVHNILFKRTLLKSVHYDFLFIYIKYILINFYAYVYWERGTKILQNQVFLADLISSTFLHFLYGTCQIWSVESGSVEGHASAVSWNHHGSLRACSGLARAGRDPLYTSLWESGMPGCCGEKNILKTIVTVSSVA